MPSASASCAACWTLASAFAAFLFAVSVVGAVFLGIPFTLTAVGYIVLNLAEDVPPFNEYHALLVCLGKNVCRKKPLCRQCCLSDICQFVKGVTG